MKVNFNIQIQNNPQPTGYNPLITDKMKKTKNTPENKAKFFALYYGQYLLTIPSKGYDKIANIVLIDKWTHIDDAFLSLRSISSLTLSEAKVVSDLQEWKDYESPISEDDRRGIRDAVGVAIKNQWFNYTAADYLRSIGILIPWMDLSVEDIKAYGWAKEDVHA